MNNILEKMEQNKKISLLQPSAPFWKVRHGADARGVFQQGSGFKRAFAQLKCVKDETFLNNLNQCDTIFMDIQAQFVKAKDQDANP